MTKCQPLWTWFILTVPNNVIVEIISDPAMTWSKGGCTAHGSNTLYWQCLSFSIPKRGNRETTGKKSLRRSHSNENNKKGMNEVVSNNWVIPPKAKSLPFNLRARHFVGFLDALLHPHFLGFLRTPCFLGFLGAHAQGQGQPRVRALGFFSVSGLGPQGFQAYLRGLSVNLGLVAF